MLTRLRRILAVVFIAGITLLFLDFTGSVHAWLGWMAKIQFLPAALALNVVVVAALVAVTLLFGRVYCSVICPLGIFQDCVSWISSRRKKKRYRFSYSPALSWLRYTVLVLFFVALVAGVGSFVALLAPYSSYGRIIQNLFSPVYTGVNNIMAILAEKADSYAFYHRDVWIRSLPVFIIAVVTFLTLIVLAWRNGRTYCNTVCPVGTVLGVLSRYSLFKPVIDTSKCNACGLCGKKCKASCIDSRNHSIDYSRCVACLDCVETCRHGAISYSIRRKSFPKQNVERKYRNVATGNDGLPQGRREFLACGMTLAACGIAGAQGKTVDGGLAVILDKKIPHRATPIVPPGAVGLKHFSRHCTGCQLCVAACPNNLLRPATGLEDMMQPRLSYERGYCRPECTRCSEVCPAGAIRKISVAEKSAEQIGHAVWVKENCLPLTEGVNCGNCARHCPAGAITMVASDPSNPESPQIPVVNDERCIGCGACENLCPSRPFSAIYVEGHERHRII